MNFTKEFVILPSFKGRRIIIENGAGRTEDKLFDFIMVLDVKRQQLPLEAFNFFWEINGVDSFSHATHYYEISSLIEQEMLDE